jgi:hypothetical protein
MKINSLGRLTDHLFAKFSGTVVDRGSYTLIQTPSNPGYHWGNYIVFDRAPRAGDLREWTEIFDKEFTYYSTPGHYVFTWDTENNDTGEYQEFLDANYEFDSAAVLTANTLNSPPHVNSDILIRKIKLNKEWEDVIKLQTMCADPKFVNKNYEGFKRRQIAEYRKMSESGKGNWFGAFIGDQLMGDLGIFYEDGVGRYQNVGTHPELRRRGICGTLVYEAGKIAINDFGLKNLVMEADLDYHAARIYESVGFKKTESNHSLSWWKNK